MKKLFLLIALLCAFQTFCQQKSFKKYDPDKKVSSKNKNDEKKSDVSGQGDEETENETISELKKAEKDFGSVSEKVSFGISLGFNNSLESLKLAQISPIDNTVIISDAQKTNFVLSTAVSVPIFYNNRKAYRFIDNKGEEQGQIHRISEWSIIGIVNLLTFSDAESGNVFNQKISGGLGISYSFSTDFSIGLSYELISYRKPKDFLIDLEGQEIQSNGETVNTIEISDNNYFFDRYASTLSLKVIYKLTKS